MSKNLLIILAVVLIGIYFGQPLYLALIPATILSTLSSIPRAFYVDVGIIIGSILTLFAQPLPPEEKVKVKKPVKMEPDESFEEMKRLFNPQPPAPKPEEPKIVEFDLDREYKLAIIKLAQNGGIVKPEEKPAPPPTYEELLKLYNERRLN